ncbi:hypothetical protein D9613_004574 [Agrocybe pediades]|uniref:Uncharacterized protein n=1 Tax=Agrocybe pediades TaxID=84607 RepID=A0A8H4VJ68_9AGAR|nr:hypothetical protein D9613_004574 [Agrocybe pediades]
MKAAAPIITDIADARVTVIRPLQVGDLGFIFTTHGIMLGRVIGMAAKSSGKYGSHCPVTETSNIAAVSNITVQLFQNHIARKFLSVCDATLSFHTKYFHVISSLQFLCLADTRVPTSSGLDAASFELSPEDMVRFRTLRQGQNALSAAMKLSKKKGALKDLVEDSEE